MTTKSETSIKLFVVALLLVGGLALMVGFDLSESPWLNSDIGAAQADGMQVDNRLTWMNGLLIWLEASAQTNLNVQKLQSEQAILTAQTQATMDEINLTAALSAELARTEARLRQWGLTTVVNTALLAFQILLVGGSVLAVGWLSLPVLKRTLALLPERASAATAELPAPAVHLPADRWQDPIYRTQKRIEAQEKEKKIRQSHLTAEKIIAERAASAPPARRNGNGNGNGHTRQPVGLDEMQTEWSRPGTSLYDPNTGEMPQSIAG